MSRSWIIILLSSLLAAALLHPAAGTSGIAQECKALLEFKAAIKKDPIGWLSNWNASTDCCTWFGTSCDSKRHITHLEIAPDPAFDGNSKFLEGTISPTLAQLTHLQSLDFSNLKRLSGCLPAALGAVTTLYSLSFRSNLLTGAIPSSYGSLTNLTFMDLGDNRLSGSIPSTLGNIGTQLRWIDLGNNQLSGAIPASLYNLTGFQVFTLSNNKLTGQIPRKMASNLKNLLNIDFTHNKLTGPIPQGAPFSTDFPNAFDYNAGLCGKPLAACKR